MGTAAQLAAAWKKLRAMPDNAPVSGWSDVGDVPASQVLRELAQGLNDRINRVDPRTPKGRKSSDAYQRHLDHDARAIADSAQRAVQRGRNILSTPELKRRYPQIDNPPTDD